MEKELMLKMNYAKSHFTYVEETIADYFVNNNPSLPIHDLAKVLSVSSASITRFCKKIGLKNYKELLYLYEKHLDENHEPTIHHISTDLQSEYFAIFQQIDDHIYQEDVERICELIHEHRIINIFALGLSATAAQDFKFRFSRTGKFIEVIYDRDAISMSSRVLEKDDLVFFFTLRGHQSFVDCALHLKQKGVHIVSIIANKKSPLVKLSDVVLFTADLKGEESTGVISAQIPILILLDIIYYCYVRKYKDAIEKWAGTEEVLQTEWKS